MNIPAILGVIWPCLLAAMLFGGLIGWFLKNAGAAATVVRDESAGLIETLRGDLEKSRRECAECAESRKSLQARLGELEAELGRVRAEASVAAPPAAAVAEAPALEVAAPLVETPPAPALEVAAPTVDVAPMPPVETVAPAVAAPVVAAAALAGGAATSSGPQSDNLEDIYGVGPKLASMLRGLGITTFRQIATWSDTDIDRIDAHLEDFQGRIRRENWVESARECHWRKYGEAIGGYIPGTGRVAPTEE